MAKFLWAAAYEAWAAWSPARCIRRENPWLVRSQAMAEMSEYENTSEHSGALHSVLQRLWPEVRRRHLYPELPFPRFERGGSRAAVEMYNKQITLNLNYIRETTRLLPAETVVGALLDHAVSHHTFCPWDLFTHLRLYARAKEILGDNELARKATDLFMDVVADTHAVKEKQSPLPELYRHGARSSLEEVIFSLYERIWGVDLGGSRDHQDVVGRLLTIPYLDRKRWPAALTRFIRGIRPFLEKTHYSRPEEQTRMGAHGFQQYRPEEMERALREFAREASSPEQFATIFEDLQDQLPD
ncbi:MAG: hypothetical protein ACLFVT_05915, partial [Syntrophobacteria bacterium]